MVKILLHREEQIRLRCVRRVSGVSFLVSFFSCVKLKLFKFFELHPANTHSPPSQS